MKKILIELVVLLSIAHITRSRSTFCDFKKIFQTPVDSSRFDDYEILERSNFGEHSDSEKQSDCDKNLPKAFANAQVLVHVQNDKSKTCKDDICHSDRTCHHNPYPVPYYPAIPYPILNPYLPSYPFPMFPYNYNPYYAFNYGHVPFPKPVVESKLVLEQPLVVLDEEQKTAVQLDEVYEIPAVIQTCNCQHTNEPTSDNSSDCLKVKTDVTECQIQPVSCGNKRGKLSDCDIMEEVDKEINCGQSDDQIIDEIINYDTEKHGTKHCEELAEINEAHCPHVKKVLEDLPQEIQELKCIKEEKKCVEIEDNKRVDKGVTNCSEEKIVEENSSHQLKTLEYPPLEALPLKLSSIEDTSDKCVPLIKYIFSKETIPEKEEIPRCSKHVIIEDKHHTEKALHKNIPIETDELVLDEELLEDDKGELVEDDIEDPIESEEQPVFIFDPNLNVKDSDDTVQVITREDLDKATSLTAGSAKLKEIIIETKEPDDVMIKTDYIVPAKGIGEFIDNLKKLEDKEKEPIKYYFLDGSKLNNAERCFGCSSCGCASCTSSSSKKTFKYDIDDLNVQHTQKCTKEAEMEVLLTRNNPAINPTYIVTEEIPLEGFNMEVLNDYSRELISDISTRDLLYFRPLFQCPCDCCQKQVIREVIPEFEEEIELPSLPNQRRDYYANAKDYFVFFQDMSQQKRNDNRRPCSSCAPYVGEMTF